MGKLEQQKMWLVKRKWKVLRIDVWGTFEDTRSPKNEIVTELCFQSVRWIFSQPTCHVLLLLDWLRHHQNHVQGLWCWSGRQQEGKNSFICTFLLGKEVHHKKSHNTLWNKHLNNMFTAVLTALWGHCATCIYKTSLSSVSELSGRSCINMFYSQVIWTGWKSIMDIFYVYTQLTCIIVKNSSSSTSVETFQGPPGDWINTVDLNFIVSFIEMINQIFFTNKANEKNKINKLSQCRAKDRCSFLRWVTDFYRFMKAT